VPSLTRISGLGASFAEALANREFDEIFRLLHPEVDFQAMTPRRTWEAHDPRTVVEDVLQRWFEESDQIEEFLDLQVDAVGERQRLGYRFRGHNDDGPFVVEQQAYISERDGRIGWMRVVCSGFQPLD
jgi:hypothetical protein